MENKCQSLAEAKIRIENLERELQAVRNLADAREKIIQHLKSRITWKLTSPFREVTRFVVRSAKTPKTAGDTPNCERTWKGFFKDKERQFRIARRAIWKKNSSSSQPIASILPISSRAVEIQADLKSAIRRHRKAA